MLSSFLKKFGTTTMGGKRTAPKEKLDGKTASTVPGADSLVDLFRTPPAESTHGWVDDPLELGLPPTDDVCALPEGLRRSVRELFRIVLPEAGKSSGPRRVVYGVHRLNFRFPSSSSTAPLPLLGFVMNDFLQAHALLNAALPMASFGSPLLLDLSRPSWSASREIQSLVVLAVIHAVTRGLVDLHHGDESGDCFTVSPVASPESSSSSSSPSGDDVTRSSPAPPPASTTTSIEKRPRLESVVTGDSTLDVQLLPSPPPAAKRPRTTSSATMPTVVPASSAPLNVSQVTAREEADVSWGWSGVYYYWYEGVLLLQPLLLLGSGPTTTLLAC